MEMLKILVEAFLTILFFDAPSKDENTVIS
jgi:hypothetical protein